MKINKKRCNLCGKIKDVEQFSKHNGRIGGFSEECRECVSERNHKRYAATRFGPERMRSFKQHAKILKVPFDLTVADLEWLWQKQGGLCFYSKIPMVFTVGCYNTVSVDRVNSNKGYVVENIVLCCSKVNIMKGKESYQKLLKMCKAIVKNPLDIDIITNLKEGAPFSGGGHNRKIREKSKKHE